MLRTDEANGHRVLTRTPAQVATSRFAADVRAGLDRPGQKELPSKYLYDAVGSALFDTICVLPEYGLARAGTRLLRRHAASLAEPIDGSVVVAELGSGSARATRFVLEALARRHPVTYCPIDISPAALAQAERELDRLDSVSIVGFEREYIEGLEAVAEIRTPGQALLVLFLGGTIGNFDRPAGERFLRQVRTSLRAGDRLLLSTDLVKPVPVLVRAYDDPIGVTAAFDLNLLARINRELGADFDPRRFRHEARWDRAERRIEMHLRSLSDHVVRVPGGEFEVGFREGETIWTESSHKYALEEIPLMAERAGFRCETQWVDREWPFAQNLLTAT